MKTIAFAEAANRLPGGYVDVVVLDVEGHERTIIEDIDLERHRVKFIVYEHKHLSASDCAAVESKLRRYGFSLKQIRPRHDCVPLPGVSLSRVTING